MVFIPSEIFKMYQNSQPVRHHRHLADFLFAPIFPWANLFQSSISIPCLFSLFIKQVTWPIQKPTKTGGNERFASDILSKIYFSVSTKLEATPFLSRLLLIKSNKCNWPAAKQTEEEPTGETIRDDIQQQRNWISSNSDVENTLVTTYQTITTTIFSLLLHRALNLFTLTPVEGSFVPVWIIRDLEEAP